MKVYPILPCAKPRMTQRDRWKKRPCVLKYHAFKDECRIRNVEIPVNGALIEFYIPMPKSWSLKKKEKMAYTPHRQTPDIDNLLKGIFDAVLKEDSHIWSIYSIKIWSFEPRIIIDELDPEIIHQKLPRLLEQIQDVS